MADKVAVFYWSIGGLPKRGQITVPEGFDPREYVELYIAAVNKARLPNTPPATLVRFAPNG
jgi:hypothetical protein